VRTRWETLYETFNDIVRNTDERTFTRLASGAPLAAFPDLQGLLAYLVEGTGDLDERDRVLGALVAQARRAHTRELATALLWLALWPGLCGVYRRRLRWRACADESVSAIAYEFTSLVAELDVARVRRVAATLVRSTERAVVAALRAPSEEVPLGASLLETLNVSPCVLEHELRVARQWLERLLGTDADLVLAVAVLDEPHGEAAERIGISAVSARKRYQRALARMRETYVREAVA
jgi:RNA polymerase sigma-70 factor (ECF subfamily)